MQLRSVVPPCCHIVGAGSRRLLAEIVGDRFAARRSIDDEPTAADVSGRRVHHRQREADATIASMAVPPSRTTSAPICEATSFCDATMPALERRAPRSRRLLGQRRASDQDDGQKPAAHFSDSDQAMDLGLYGFRLRSTGPQPTAHRQKPRQTKGTARYLPAPSFRRVRSLELEPDGELNHAHVVRLVRDLAERRVAERRARRRRPLHDVEQVQHFEADATATSTRRCWTFFADRQVDVVPPRREDARQRARRVAELVRRRRARTPPCSDTGCRSCSPDAIGDVAVARGSRLAGDEVRTRRAAEQEDACR